MREMIDPGKIQKELKTGMPPMVRRAIIGEWIRDELKNRPGAEIAHYLTSYHYDFINPGFVLTFKFTFEPGFLEAPISEGSADVEAHGE